MFLNWELSYPEGIPDPKTIILSFAILKPEIVTLPSDPTTSSPSHEAPYTNVSFDAVAATDAPLSRSTLVPLIEGEETSKTKSTSANLVIPSSLIDPLEPPASGPKAISKSEIPGATSTPAVERRSPFPYPAGKVSVFKTILSVAASKLLIDTSPSIATGTPFSNLTEYSNISPAEAAVTAPEDKSTTGLPVSAAWFIDKTLTLEASETPFSVMVWVLSFTLPIVMTVSPLILEAWSTFVVPPVTYVLVESEDP